MSPTSFQFTLTMPGDRRLVGAVRSLTEQAAAYAVMKPEDASAFAQRVVGATEAAITASGRQDAPIEFRFECDVEALTVTISANSGQISRLRQPITA